MDLPLSRLSLPGQVTGAITGGRLARVVISAAWLVAGLLLVRVSYFSSIGLVKLATGAVGLAGCVAAAGVLARPTPRMLLAGVAWAVLGVTTGAAMALRNHQSAGAVVLLSFVGGALLLLQRHQAGARRP